MSNSGSRVIVRTLVAAAFVFAVAPANAFVGMLSIGLGEVDEDIGRIQTSFSADGAYETEDMSGTGRLYYKPGKVRDELNMQGQDMVMINRLDLKKAWIIMQAQNMYIEADPEEGSEQAPSFTLVSREKLGTEEVNGMTTTKYESVYESQDGRFGGFTWYTDDNIAVRGHLFHEVDGEKERFKFELSNLQRGEQSDGLFELPAGMSKLDVQGMMNRSGAAAPAAAGTQPQADSSADEPGLAEEMGDAAKDETETQAVEEVRNQVRKGFGKLFDR